MSGPLLAIYVAGTLALGIAGLVFVLRALRDLREPRRRQSQVPIDRPQVPLQPKLGPGLTSGERLVLHHLAEAWNKWCHVMGDVEQGSEMADAIHRAQDLVALRVAQRVDPDVWAAGPAREQKSGAEMFEAGDRFWPGSNPPPPAGGKPSPPPGPPPAAEPYLTNRELWLMTRSWNASRETNAARSVGEWLRERTISVRPAEGAPVIYRPRSAALARDAVRMFGEPGRTPEAS
jgi:hypothetical protein